MPPPPTRPVEDYRQVMQKIEENTDEEVVTDIKGKLSKKVWEQQKVTEFYERKDWENEQEINPTEQILETEDSRTRTKYKRDKDMQTASTRPRNIVQVSEIVTKYIPKPSTSSHKELGEEEKLKSPREKSLNPTREKESRHYDRKIQEEIIEERDKVKLPRQEIRPRQNILV